MFDISWGELVLVGMVALIVIGPKELPTVLRTVGQWMTKIRRMASEFQGQFQEAMREAEFADLKKQVDSISDPTRSFTEFNPLDTAQKEIDSAFADKPADAPAVTLSGEPAAATAPAEPATASSPPTGEATPSGGPAADGTPAPKPNDLEGGRAA